MNIRPVGEDIESECFGCGEPLLIGSGDAVHVKLDFTSDFPLPIGFLCRGCNAKEGGGELLAKAIRMVCSECGSDIGITDLFPSKDDGCDNLLCGDCRENASWRE